MRERLDVGLVRRGLVRSRSAAHRLITDGAVTVAGEVVTRPSAKVDDDASITIDRSLHPFVSRGGEKLADALDVFGIDVAGSRAIDVGASTGGFTDCLLQRGAQSVVALDVGTDQLAPTLRSDPRVDVMEGTDVRVVDPEALGAPFAVVAADLSFISLRPVLRVLATLGHDATTYVLLVKPQFEVGRGNVGRSGVVRSATLRRQALHSVVTAAAEVGFNLHGATPASVAGASGNREYVIHLGFDAPRGSFLAREWGG